ncbi:MAG: F0F1 ATP synthase subunit A [Chloroflexi bacterium]|nr:F0F1 ATP synthase subunit A [Chloroflexota bacterium]
MNRTTLIIIIVLLVLPSVLVYAGIFPTFDSKSVTASVAVKPEVLFNLNFGAFKFEISNTLLTTWIVTLLIVLFVYFATRQMSLIPSGLQNLLELIIEMLDGLATSVAGERGRMFFPWIATIFLFVLVSNWLGLIPGFGPVGYIPVSEEHPAPKGIMTFDLGKGFSDAIGPEHKAAAGAKEGEHSSAPAEEEEQVLAPFVRSPSTDMNTTLALALISVIATQVYGMKVVGPIKYWTKFFAFAKLGDFFGALFKGKFNIGLLMFGFLDLFVGLLEFISEMVKILSFTFRLFGNIFAGEVVLLIMAFLFSALPLPFYGLELFVGFMQAFVFCILTLVFMTIATTAHSAEAHH